MEGISQETQTVLSDENILENIISRLVNDFASLVYDDIGWLFIGFYGFMALCCCILFYYCSREKGLLRHMACACVMLCVFLSGFVASLAVIDLKQPRLVIEKEMAEKGSPKTLVTGSKSYSLGYMEPPEVKPLVVPEKREPVERGYPRYDENGYPENDDLSHERYYPPAERY